MKPKNGYVYAVHDKDRGITKIGRGANAEKRIAAIISQGGIINHDSFYVLTGDYYSVETAVHKDMACARMAGTEWFKIGLDEAKTAIQKNVIALVDSNNDSDSVDLVFSEFRTGIQCNDTSVEKDAEMLGMAACCIDGKFLVLNPYMEVIASYESAEEMVIREFMSQMSFCKEHDEEFSGIEYIYYRHAVDKQTFDVACAAIRDGIAADMPYKYIFQLCKARVMSISQQLLQ